MGWGNQVDIVASSLLQIQHHGGQVLDPPFSTLTSLADFPVDAKNASQTAMAEKDGSRPAAAYQTPFFSEVGMMRSNE
jgi:hypothetical protein